MNRPAASSLATTLLTSAVLVLSAGACSKPDVDVSQKELSARTVELPAVDRVILVTIDTLRADHLSSFGYPIETSPWLDGLIERGVVFRRAYAQSATTKPAHASLFTSLYPIEHGVLKNGQVMAEDLLTMAEMMRAEGYLTAGFVSADVPLGSHVGQGFEHWDWPKWKDSSSGRKLYRPAGETIDRAIAWLDNEALEDERMFLWIHLYDPHPPLQPPAEALALVSQAANEIQDQHKRLLAQRDIPARAASRYDKILKYDAEILYADRQLARLEQSLGRRGLNRDALWIVTSDHGQGLGAHGWFDHSVQIYNAQLHVPLVFWFTAGSVPPRTVADHVVEHIDVLPTLAELVGGDLSTQIVPVRGRSLTPLLRGESGARSRSYAFAQRSEYATPSRSRLGRGNYEPGSRFSLQSLDFKYLLFTEGEDEFYDLAADPYELINLVEDPLHLATSELFAEQITTLVDSSVQKGSVETVSDEDVERLRALGYIQ